MQVLARRLRFQLERAPGESSLIDRTGRTLKMEPLATVGDLERYLLKMVRLSHSCFHDCYTAQLQLQSQAELYAVDIEEIPQSDQLHAIFF